MSASQKALSEMRKRKASAEAEAEGDGEGGPDAGAGGKPQVEHQGGESEGWDPSEHQLEAGATEILRQPPRLEVEGPVQVADHVTQDDAVGQLERAERGHRGQQALGDEGERDCVDRIEPADVAPLAEHDQQDVGLDEAEHGVGEDTGERGAPVGRVAPVRPSRHRPVERKVPAADACHPSNVATYSGQYKCFTAPNKPK